MNQSLTMWCGLGGHYYYPRNPSPDQAGGLEKFLDHCQESGVSSLRFYFGFVHYGEPSIFRLEQGRRPFEPGIGQSSFELYPGQEADRETGWDPFSELVEKAHARDIKIWGYTSPQYQGSLQANPHSPIGEKLPYLFLSEFANQHPEYWLDTADGTDSLERDGYVILDLAHAPVRQHLCNTFSRLAREKGLDGLELEWIAGSEPVSPYLVKSGQEHDRQAVDPVKQFIKQLRLELGGTVSLSAAVLDDPDKARVWGYDWPAWSQERLVDALVLRYSGRDTAALANNIRRARELGGENTKLISQLNVWSKTGFQDPSGLTTAVQTALTTGAGQVGIYRADAVEAMNLWPVIREISDLDVR